MSEDTILANLKKLPQPHKAIALRNYLSQNRKSNDKGHNNRGANSISDALNKAFNWLVSPQGHHFWNVIHDQLIEFDDDISKVKWPKITKRHRK